MNPPSNTEQEFHNLVPNDNPSNINPPNDTDKTTTEIETSSNKFARFLNKYCKYCALCVGCCVCSCLGCFGCCREACPGVFSE